LDWILIRYIFAFSRPGCIGFCVPVVRDGVCVVFGRKEYETDDYELFGLNSFYKSKPDIFWSKSFETCWICELLFDIFLEEVGGSDGIDGIGGIGGIAGIAGIEGIEGICGILGISGILGTVWFIVVVLLRVVWLVFELFYFDYFYVWGTITIIWLFPEFFGIEIWLYLFGCWIIM
jgi:hypothetical protein